MWMGKRHPQESGVSGGLTIAVSAEKGGFQHLFLTEHCIIRSLDTLKLLSWELLLVLTQEKLAVGCRACLNHKIMLIFSSFLIFVSTEQARTQQVSF